MCAHPLDAAGAASGSVRKYSGGVSALQSGVLTDFMDLASNSHPLDAAGAASAASGSARRYSGCDSACKNDQDFRLSV